MKLVIFLIIAFSQFAIANNNSCSISLPPGRTDVQVLQQSQFVEHTPNQIQTVYSCGPFVNDGSVVTTPSTQIVELVSGGCAAASYPGLNYIIYCK